jgi:predicted outer membrane repeat protein
MTFAMFTIPVAFPMSHVSTSHWLAIARATAIGDMNGDGAPDLIVGNQVTVFTYRLQVPPESLVVTTAVDEDNGNARPSNGTGTSLREAFNYARSLSGNQTITFASSLGKASAVLNITGAPFVVDGLVNPQVLTLRNDAGQVTLRGDGTKSLFDVRFLGNLTLENLNITNFRASHSSGNGGAVYVAGLGTLNVFNSTFYGNSAAGAGGAIYSAADAVTLIRNSTFNANTGQGAIAIDSTSSLGLQNNTIVGNTGGGVRAVAGTLRLSNNIIVGNVTDLSVGTGTFTGDRNIVQVGPLGNLTNTINADPSLGALADNGGRTLTMLPSQFSPAIDAGATLSTVTTDQRGIVRPQILAPDIGAVELSPENFSGVTTPDGARWFLFGQVSGNQRIFRQAPGESAVEVGGLATSIALQGDGNVVVRDASGAVYVRTGSASGIGATWSLRSSIVSGDGATWFLGTDGGAGNFNIYRWTATGSPQFANGNGVRLVAVNGFAIAQNSTGSVFLRVFSNVGFGTAWIT